MTRDNKRGDIKDTRVGRRGFTILNKELNVLLTDELEKRLLDNTFIFSQMNETLLLILGQLEMITGSDGRSN